jgi:hypothetical protein
MRSGEAVHQRRRAIAAAWRLFDIVSFFVEDSVSILFSSSLRGLFSSCCVESALWFVVMNELLADSVPPLSCLFAVCTHDNVVGSA